MKKKILLFALIAAMAFSAVGASAASADGQSASTAQVAGLEYKEADGDVYTIKYKVGEKFNDEYFGILVVEGIFDPETSTLGELVYVDQVQVKDGYVEVKNFSPIVKPSDDNFQESTVYIGGEGFNGGLKKAMEYLTYDECFYISGEADGADSVTVMQGEKKIKNIPLADGGSFRVPVPEGESENESYSIVYSKNSYLDYIHTGIAVNSTEEINLPVVDVTAIEEGLCGDFNGDGQKTIEDLAELIAAFTSQESKYDIVDGDGVNVTDITAFLAARYGECAVEVPYNAQ